ncbi:MAG: M56 family metallopeptidase [Oscillibacter sp.]|nr:M56 family metallopeptidase [Oscillibacter sp.]
MREILLTSSGLILALLVLRRLFRNTLSRRVQYALWGLVLLRLLTPLSLPAAGFSLLTAAEPVALDTGSRSLYMEPAGVTLRGPEGAWSPYTSQEDPRIVLGPSSEDNIYIYSNRHQVIHEVEYTHQIALEDLFRWTWYIGMALMALWLAWSNLRFWGKLRKGRRPYFVEGAKRPVYLVERGLPSPCLFGLFRPAVYLTPAAVQSPDSLRHVMAHEESHARHGDPLWSLLRGVCLVAYWFDPLVWWAALASRTDCELACDEAALRRLGEAERIPYGRTLLSLIPVRKSPGNPLLSATTMTAGKRQLTDRIARIAGNRRNLGTALFAAVALAALVCAVTFTGAKKTEEEAAFSTVDEAVAVLAEELENYGGPDGDIMSKLIVYTPENPPEFFDLEEGELLRVYWGVLMSASSSRERPMGWLGSLYRLEPDAEEYPDSAQNTMEILGGDSRCRYVLTQPKWAPEMKTGRTEGMSLMNQVAGRIREAVLSCESLQTAEQPDWEPVLTIPLDGLEPYEPQAAEALSSPNEDGSMRMLGGLEDPEHVLGEYGLLFFEAGPPASMGGKVFAGVQRNVLSSWPRPFWSFRPGAGGKYSASFFRNLLGHDGFCITYNANDGPRTLTHEYYYLNEEGWPVLLARMEGFPAMLDLDGDGEKELVSGASFAGEFYFRRGENYYRVDLNDVLEDVWPGFNAFWFEGWDTVSRSQPFRVDPYSLSSHTPLARSNEYRTLYFDGENLLVYNDQRHFADHMAAEYDFQAGVRDNALAVVEQAYKDARMEGAFYDDWRITGVDGICHMESRSREYLLWAVSYEFHAPEPQDSPALKGEDCWVDPCYPETTYLVFREVPQGGETSGTALVFCTAFRQAGNPTEERLRESLEGMEPEWTIDLGVATLQAPAVSASELAQAALDEILEGETAALTLLVPEGGGRYNADIQAAGEPDRLREFTGDYDWSYADSPGSMPATSLLVMNQGGNISLRFWPDSELVFLHHWRGDAWLRAVSNRPQPDPFDVGIFGFMRLWYDDAEFQALQGDIAIPDRGQGRLEIAREWVEAYTQPRLRCTPGSHWAYTYSRTIVELEEHLTPDIISGWEEDEDRLYFSYHEIFVLENDSAYSLSGNLAGNAAAYQGEYGKAPNGAHIRWAIGYLAKTEDGWRCGQLGTSP